MERKLTPGTRKALLNHMISSWNAGQVPPPFIDHTPRRRSRADIARTSMLLAGQSKDDALRLFRGAIYWATVYGDATLSLALGLRGEVMVHTRVNRKARDLSMAAPWN